jgi:hypothetical protein
MVVGLAGSTNADEADLTLFIKCILDSSKVVDRAIPYYEYLLYHPPAAPIIGAFAHIISGYPIEKIVVSLAATYTVLSTLATYSLVKAVFKNNKIPFIACVILLLSWNFWHPLCFTFTVPIAAFSIMSTMALMIHICRSFERRIILNTIILSLLISFSLYLHPMAFIYALTWFISLNVTRLITLITRHFSIPIHIQWSNFRKLFLTSLFGLGLIMLFSTPYVKTVYTFLTASTSGLPSDWIFPIERNISPISGHPYYEPTGMLYDVFYLSDFATSHGGFLYLGPFCIVFIIGTPLLLFLHRKVKEDRAHSWGLFWSKWASLAKWGITSFIHFEMILIFLKYLYKIEFPIPLLSLSSYTWIKYLFDPLRSWEMLYIPLMLLTCGTFEFIILSTNIIKKEFNVIKVNFNIKIKTLKTATFKIPIINRRSIIPLILCVIVVSQAILSYQSGVGNYLTWPLRTYERPYTYIRQYSLLTIDDLTMFEWIKSFTSKDDVFLVSQADTGQYLTSVTDRKSIFPFGPLEGSINYRILTFALESEPNNPYILPLLRSYNISYVFVGSKVYDPTAPTWKEAYTYNAFFDPKALLHSPLFELVKKIGASYLFKVTSDNNLDLTGPTVSVFTDSLMIGNTSTLGKWETRLGTDKEIDFLNSKSVTFISKLLILFKFRQTIDFSNITYICFWVKSSDPGAYSLLIYDVDNNYRYWTFNADSQISFVVLNLVNFSGKSKQDISLKNISLIEIDLSKPIESLNETTLNFGPILIPKRLTKVNLLEVIDSSKHTSQWFMSLNNYDNYTLLLPSFLKWEDIEPTTVSVKIYPASIIFIETKNKQNCTLSFRLASTDPRFLNLKFISRPLRDIVLYTVNTTSNVSFSYDSDTVLFGEKTLNVSLKTWDFSIIKVENFDLDKGKILLGVFIDGGIRGSNSLVIGVYRTLSDAESQRNFITELKLSDVQRWVLFENEITELSSLYLRIDSLDLVGDFNLWIRVYSFGRYY